jgi:F0F1-type ATP synthase membrane subunit b/b'
LLLKKYEKVRKKKERRRSINNSKALLWQIAGFGATVRILKCFLYTKLNKCCGTYNEDIYR